MSAVTVNHVEYDHADDAPPPRTPIVRPLRHVRAVRERHLRRFATASDVAASRAARAWAWALGEVATAPVTDRQTATPASRADIEAEIQAADERRLHGDHENRADAAATILRWLIGGDDRVPIRCQDPGELVGGFGDIVRTRQQIADLLAIATEGRGRAATLSRDVSAASDGPQQARRQADYLSGVVSTLAWILGKQAEAPITRRRFSIRATRDIKAERVHADDLIDQAASSWMGGREPSPWYGEGVRSTVNWLLGDSTLPPIDPQGGMPYT